MMLLAVWPKKPRAKALADCAARGTCQASSKTPHNKQNDFHTKPVLRLNGLWDSSGCEICPALPVADCTAQLATGLQLPVT